MNDINDETTLCKHRVSLYRDLHAHASVNGYVMKLHCANIECPFTATCTHMHRKVLPKKVQTLQTTVIVLENCYNIVMPRYLI